MIRLKDAFRGERAVVIFGGPSLIEQHVDFSVLARKDCVVFLEAKALTPRFLEYGVEPDFYLMPFPEKTKDNALQSFVFRALLAGVNIVPLLKERWRPVARDLKQGFDRYYETWRPHKGPHKRYRFRPGAYLPDSPFDLLGKLADVHLIAHRQGVAREFPSYAPGDRLHVFETLEPEGDFTLARYFDTVDQDGAPHLRQFSGQLNSAAIAVYPLLHYMGFKLVYCLGMDMSMVGSMEYAAPYTFWSMMAFRWFFYRTRQTFNADYRPNRPYYYRPASEFADLRRLVQAQQLMIVRVYRPSRYAAAIPDIPTISLDQFLSA